MTYEDFTTYTEVDSGDDITVTETRVSHDTMLISEDSYVYKDFGAGYFGDFQHIITVKGSVFSNILARWNAWALWNEYGTRIESNGIYVLMEKWLDEIMRIILYERHNGDSYYSRFYGVVGTIYYLTIDKEGTAFTCKVYDDEARTNLLDTLSLTLHENVTYRYLHVLQSILLLQSLATTGYSENLDLEGVPVAKAKPANILPLMRGMDLIGMVKPFSKRFPKLNPLVIT